METQSVYDFISIKWQEGTLPEVGLNGCFVEHVLEIALRRLKELNNEFPCRENAISITKLEEAIMWQERRTKNRIEQCVEGQRVPHV